jgi:hypothetical protein
LIVPWTQLKVPGVPNVLGVPFPLDEPLSELGLPQAVIMRQITIATPKRSAMGDRFNMIPPTLLYKKYGFVWYGIELR